MISLIAAIGQNNELGKNNELIWRLPNDLKFFKEMTINHPIVMGHNTYNSIGRPLPNRDNIVLASKHFNDNRIIQYNDIDELTEDITNCLEEYFIIGGSSLYNYYYPLADKMYLTMIKASDPFADAYFPNINYDEWTTKIIGQNEDNNISYDHVEFTRIRTK